MRGVGVRVNKEVLYKRKIECVFIGGLFLFNVRDKQSYCIAFFVVWFGFGLCLGMFQDLIRVMRV